MKSETIRLAISMCARIAQELKLDFSSERVIRGIVDECFPEILETYLVENKQVDRQVLSLRDKKIDELNAELVSSLEREQEISNLYRDKEWVHQEMAEEKLKEILQSIIDGRYEIW